MSEPIDGGEKPHILSSDMEIEKGKEKLQESDIHTGKRGEGTSGTNKEGSAKGETRKSRKCFPKSKRVPKLYINLEWVREEIQYMKEHALIGKFVGICPTEKTLVW